MVRLSRRDANLFVALAILAGALFTGGAADARPVHHAGVVVQHGDLGTLTDCVAFTEREIDGIDLIERSRFEYRSAKFPEGTGVCWLDGEGCRTTRSDQCFCTPAFGTTASWSYWVQERADEPMVHHGETYPSGRVIRDGSVDYWTFGPHGTPPASLHSISDICGSHVSTPASDETPLPYLAWTRDHCAKGRST